jgi:hypothetical protein
MGTIYYVACRKCKVVRDLDKFYDMYSVKDRDEALELSRSLNQYRAALLTSFMGEHMGHDCVAFTEHNDDLCDQFKKEGSNWELNEDGDFWTTTCKEKKSESEANPDPQSSP